jgi:uncharacterized protein
MKIVGKVESLWRYPVKSMQGEQLAEAFAGYPGIYGDRVYAFRSSSAPAGFPYLTAREQQALLQYRPLYRDRESMAKPPNLAEAESLGPGLTPIYAGPAELMVDVETPTGERLAIDDPKLIRMLCEGIRDNIQVTLLRSDRALTDCRPVSIFSIQTARQLGAELSMEMDKRRFRANIYAELESSRGFVEDSFVGRTVRVGPKATIAVLERDPRCKMITLDPDSAQAEPEVMRRVARDHDGKAGVYGAVLVEGIIRPGDEIALLG